MTHVQLGNTSEYEPWQPRFRRWHVSLVEQDIDPSGIYGDHVQDDADAPGRKFATVIRDARRRRGWTQDDLLARLAAAVDKPETAISRSTLLRWEKGDVERPDLSQVRQLMLVLEADPREAVIALGLVTRDELGLPPQRSLDPVVAEAQRHLDDERIPQRVRDNLRRGLQAAIDVWLDHARIRPVREPSARDRAR